MQGEIWRRKLSYYGYVKNIQDDRWPKIVLTEVEKENPVINAWLNEVQKAMDEVGVIYIKQGVKEWRNVVNKQIENWEQRVWQEETTKNSKLRLYPKDKLESREVYLNGSRASKMICKFRLNDVGQYGDTAVCGVCQEEVRDMRRHIIRDCEQLKEAREDGEWHVEGVGEGSEEWMKKILSNKENWKRLCNLGLEWEKRCGKRIIRQ